MDQKYNHIETLHPKAEFPFLGNSTLSVQCKTIGYSNKRILVLRINRCSYPFPFSSLEVIADNDGREADPETDRDNSEKKPTNYSSKKNKKNEAKKPIGSSAEPNNSSLPTLFIEIDDRFEFLEGKKIIKTPKEECKYISGEFKTALHSTLVKRYGTGDGKFKEGDIGRADLKIERITAPATFSVFTEIIHQLNNYEEIEAQLINIPSETTIGTIQAPLLLPSYKRQWSYLTFDKAQLIGQPRLFMIAGIILFRNDRTQNFLIIDIERRHEKDTYKLEILRHNLEADMAARLAINKLTYCNGRLNDIQTINDCLFRVKSGIKHKFDDSRLFAKAIYEAIC